MEEPIIHVGIVSGSNIRLRLNGEYLLDGQVLTGPLVATADGEVVLGDYRGREITLEPKSDECSFSIEDVTIGVNFHWERKETQTFRGQLRLLYDEGKVVCINDILLEQYLESVISSEMSATSSLPLLEAHAVISRSWVMRNRKEPLQSGLPPALPKGRELKYPLTGSSQQDCSPLPLEGSGEATPTGESLGGASYIHWYDHSDHKLFDVCADDHCQRYQGITKETSPNVKVAIAKTRGQVLWSDGEICDARFSKSCGGISEEYEYCWEDSHKKYLEAVRDEEPQPLRPSQGEGLGRIGLGALNVDLTSEAQADQWIRTAPPAFCNTADKKILSQVLNDYDQETTDFYRWTVTLGQEQLHDLLLEKLNIDFGQVKALEPVKRGKSGRIWLLRIVGTKQTLLLGKELEIRRALSESHLYSSAFVVDTEDVDADGVPARFVLHGAGWGHGVGLCQIGAAVMGAKGYSYEQILFHYYKNAELKRLYS